MDSDSVSTYHEDPIIFSILDDEPEALVLPQLKLIIEEDPNSVFARDEHGRTPLHFAARYSSPAFCKMIIAVDNSVRTARTTDSDGYLPFHDAICNGNLETAKYLFEVYPESIHVRGGDGRRQTPLETARGYSDLRYEVSYFERQLNYVEQLPLHRALKKSNVSLGAIKLIIEANPQSLRSTNSHGQLPLHIACSNRDISVIKFLEMAYPNSFQTRDANNDLPLHCACRGGNFDAINYILEKPDHGVDALGGENMLPIHLLLLCSNCDRDSLTYVDTVGRLLRLNPATLISSMMM